MSPDSSETFVVEIPPLTGVHAEPFSLGKMVRQMKFFGPAAVVASLSLGAGETIMATGLGSWSEYNLLWLLLLSVLVRGVFVTYLIGRYTAITGQGIGYRLVMLPGPRGWLLLAILTAEVGLLSMGLTTIAKPCGNLITYLLFDRLPEGWAFGVWENIWTTVLMAAAMLFSLLVSYRALERQQIVICGIVVTGTVIAGVLVQPDLLKLVTGVVSFGVMPEVPRWAPTAARDEYVLVLVTIFGYVGGSLSGYLAYSNWVGLSGWGLNSHKQIAQIRDLSGKSSQIDYLPEDPDQARRMRVLLSSLRWDVGMGAVVLFVVTAAFLTAGAAVLYPRQQTIGNNAWELLTKQAGIWAEIHDVLVPVYYIAVAAAMWGTLACVPEAITRVSHSFLCAIWPRFESFPRRRLHMLIVAWFFLTSLIWIWTGVTFNLLTQIAAFLTANLGLSVVCICVVYFNWTLPALYRPRWWVTLGGALSAIILLLCAAGGAVGLSRKLLAAFS